MDFFKYTSMVSLFSNELWVILLVNALCFALVFSFQAIALYIIAKREGYKNSWMAFVPVLSTYYIGVCAQKNKIYGMDTKKIGIAAAVFELVLIGLYILDLVAQILLGNAGCIEEVKTITSLGNEIYALELFNVPENLNWAAWIFKYMQKYILSILDLLYLLLQISLLIAFFQTYACRRYVIFSITSILFPIQGILFFTVRNNKGVNYREFVLAQQARQYQQYQQYQQFQQSRQNDNPYNNPYNNPYSQNPYERRSSGSATDPFDDMGGNGGETGSGGDPFEDFDK